MSAREVVADHDARGHRFCLVASRFNEAHVNRMLNAALETLRGRGAADQDLEVLRVPGGFEVPWACQAAARTGRFDAVLALAVVIRGETEHFRLVAESATDALLRVSLDTGVPVLNGVLAVHDANQADARTGGSHGNRGAEIALAAIQMARLKRTLGPA